MLQLPKKDSERIGIMGGTFDPIHLGHLVTAEEARQQFDLNYVIFVPAGNPPHKKDHLLSDMEHRYLMTVLAVMTNPYFTVSRVEIERSKQGPTFTVDTVKWFQEFYGQRTKLHFITGADAMLDILTWKDYDHLLDTCQFIAASRPGYSLNRLRKTFDHAGTPILEKVHYLEIPAMAISSTDIRERVRTGKTIKYLTSEAVENYILKNRLWK